MEKVSIIVPVYNAAEYVGKCLESVALQDYKNIEIIVVEDGSDDESPDVCKKFINAASSRTTALWTASAASFPHVNGPWLFTRTAGI